MRQPSRHPVAEVWLATPDAATRFDPSSLQEAERAEWAVLRTERRRRDWASSRALLGAVPDAGDHSRSLSHSHGYAALAFASGAVAVGVDLERLVPRDFLGMARVAFAPEEADRLADSYDPVERCSRFYELWTLKEAFAKALRLPLVDALRQCRFADSDCEGLSRVPAAGCWRATVFAPRFDLRLAFVRVADRDDLLAAPISTAEWPSPRAVDWRVARSLGGDGNAPGA
jgi:hypothetical protein